MSGKYTVKNLKNSEKQEMKWKRAQYAKIKRIGSDDHNRKIIML